MNTTLIAVVAVVSVVIVAGLLVFYFAKQARQDRREGDEARALLGESREDIDALRDELGRLGGAIETPSERRESARAEFAARGVSIDTGADASP